MIIQLQPDQISLFWDAIKHAVFSIYRVPEDDKMNAANKALSELMSGNYQCWVLYEGEGEERKTCGIVVTSIVNHLLLDFDLLKIDALYGFRKLNDDMVKDAFEALKQFALRNGCKKVVCESGVKRVKEIVQELGMDETSVCYEYVL